MKPAIHPDYRPVVFYDTSAGVGFLTRSTRTSDQRIDWEDGRTYPVIRVDISSASHPFWTGTQRILDTAGQVEKFRRRYGAGRPPRTRAGDAGAAHESTDRRESDGAR